MILTQEQAIQRLSERLYDNTRNLREKDRQRRQTFQDMYGFEMTRQADANNPAQFYVSITSDMVYMERFEFKIIIQPFASYANGMEMATVDVNPTSLTVGNTSLTDNNNAITPNPHNHEITPNPHDHSTVPHTHNLTQGITLTHTTASDFRLYVEGIDVTPYLMAQYDGEWIDGEGVYPTMSVIDNYDLLEVACDMVAEGKYDDAYKIVHAGFKPVTLTSNAPFQATIVTYIKLCHMNR